MKKMIKKLVMLGQAVVCVWAGCPTAINNMEMLVPSAIKFQVGEIFDLASQISLGSWTVLISKTT